MKMEKPINSDNASPLPVLLEQIDQCRREITTYSSQFSSSLAVSAILAALAAICSASENTSIGNLFYVLPTISLYYIYNLIKYTREVLQLGAYRQSFENLANQLLPFDHEVLCWESKIKSGDSRAETIFFGGIFQVFFAIPVAFFILWGFWQLNRNWLWYVDFGFIMIQVIVLLIMGIKLIGVKAKTFESIGIACKKKKSK